MLISDNIKQLHNIWASTKVLKYFYLPLYLQNRSKYVALISEKSMEYASNKNSHRNLGKFTAKMIFKYANDLKEDFGKKKKKGAKKFASYNRRNIHTCRKLIHQQSIYEACRNELPSTFFISDLKKGHKQYCNITIESIKSSLTKKKYSVNYVV